MAILLLVRHATTDHTGRIISSWSPGVHLNSEGRREAERVAEGLCSAPVEAIYSSPLERAVETASFLAAKLGLPVETHPGFGEVRYGEWTGRTIADMPADPLWGSFCANRSSVRPPGGETLLEAQTRMVEAVEAVARRHPGVSAVFSHSDAIRAALAHYAAIPPDLVSRVDIDPASVTAIEITGGEPRILLVNASGSLY